MQLTFTEKEFDKLRTFQDRLAKEFGDTAYVGTNNAVVLVEYSPQLTAMLRPYPPEKHYTYELLQLSCKDCKRKQLFLSLPGETNFVCDDCLGKRKKSGKPK
jgi:hypothetical protein